AEAPRETSALLSVIPLRPLPEKAEVAFFVTRGVEPSTVDGCVSTSSGAHPLIHAAKGREATAIDALVELGVIAEAEELVVLQPFVTQSIYDESVAIAEDIASRPDEDFVLDLDPDADGETSALTRAYRYCLARVQIVDHRDESGPIGFRQAGAPIRLA